jgi:anti-anti-sigma factor
VHTVAVDRTRNAAIVHASGELDAFVAPELACAFAQVKGASRVVADLGLVSFMDSTALGLVARAARELEAAGGGFRVVLPRGTARRIFEITGLDGALPVAGDLESALDELAAGG